MILPSLEFDPLSGLQPFIGFKELLYLLEEMWVDIRETLVPFEPRIAHRNREDLGVFPLFVLQNEGADRPDLDYASDFEGLVGEDHDVQRVVVVEPGLGHEAVLDREDYR